MELSDSRARQLKSDWALRKRLRVIPRISAHIGIAEKARRADTSRPELLISGPARCAANELPLDRTVSNLQRGSAARAWGIGRTGPQRRGNGTSTRYMGVR